MLGYELKNMVVVRPGSQDHPERPGGPVFSVKSAQTDVLFSRSSLLDLACYDTVDRGWKMPATLRYCRGPFSTTPAVTLHSERSLRNSLCILFSSIRITTLCIASSSTAKYVTVAGVVAFAGVPLRLLTAASLFSDLLVDPQASSP